MTDPRVTEFDYDAIRGDTAWVVANWGGSGISELNYELLAVRVPALLDRIEVLEGLVARLVEYEDGPPESWPIELQEPRPALVTPWYREALEITKRRAGDRA